VRHGRRRRWLPAGRGRRRLPGHRDRLDGGGRRQPTPLRYANDSHQQQQTLADGSVATLDAGTTLHARFGWRHRELDLERGRLQLQVAPSSKALQLRAGDSTIRDIGTTFQVERLHDGLVEVALLEGAVEVSNGAAQHTLAPGQQLQVLPPGASSPVRRCRPRPPPKAGCRAAGVRCHAAVDRGRTHEPLWPHRW
jgi:transmembrane sensor